ncbi:MAG: right-handed parallel beta-helix repeat-containing protein, partial [Tepidisphaeraceae bacterium]
MNSRNKVSNRKGNSSSRTALRRRLFSLPEALEGRVLMSTFQVTSTADAGPGSLRQAILAANANPGSDIIKFNLGTTLQHIVLNSALPDITDPLTIDATQTGQTGGPLVSLEGDGTFAAFTIDTSTTGDRGTTTIKGFSITGFYTGIVANTPVDIENNVIGGNYYDGIDINDIRTGETSSISGNFIGTDAAGSTALSNFVTGIVVANSPGVLTISGNVIANNYGDGVDINNSSNVNLTGNHIGTDAAGVSSSLGNQGNDVTIGSGSSGNTISGNTIIGSWGDGVLVDVDAGTGNKITGNYIGTNASGNQGLGNSGNGITVKVTGGQTISDNAISGNLGYGVSLSYLGGPPSDSNTVQGNHIGTSMDGTVAIGNLSDGVFIVGNGNKIFGNTIAFNVGNGVSVQSGTGNTISHNSIYANAAVAENVGGY